MHAGLFGQHPESKFEQSRLNPWPSLCCVLNQDNFLSVYLSPLDTGKFNAGREGRGGGGGGGNLV